MFPTHTMLLVAVVLLFLPQYSRQYFIRKEPKYSSEYVRMYLNLHPNIAMYIIVTDMYVHSVIPMVVSLCYMHI